MPPRRQDLLQGIVAAATDQAERSAPEPALSAVPERVHQPAAEPVAAPAEPTASPAPQSVSEVAAPTPEELLAQLDKPIDEHDDLVQLAFRVRASKRDEIKRACLDLGLNIQDFGRLSVDLLLAEVRRRK